MKYKNFLIIFVCVLIDKCFCQGSTCNFNDVASNIIQESILDTDTFTKKYTSSSGSLGDLTLDDTDPGAPYIDVTLDDDKINLIIKTNSKFSNDFEKDQIAQPVQDSIKIMRTVTLTCEDSGSSPTVIKFMLEVKDTNNHEPEFNKSTYSYTMPMPLIPNIDLTGFGEEISATDIDIGNKDITFTIDQDEKFEVESVSMGSKRYKAVLKAKSFTHLSEDTTLTLMATDAGSPPRTSTTQIKIAVDKDNSLPDIPTVPKGSYEFEYSLDGEKPILTPKSDEIIVTTSDADKTSVTLENGDPYFTSTFDKESKKVTIESTGTPIESATDSILVLTLVVSLEGNEDDRSETAILIKMPKDQVIGIPQFSKPYYTATYSTDTDPHTITLDEDITVSEDATVTLDDDPDNHFTLSKVDNKWQIKVEKNLDEDVIKKGGEIHFTLHATVSDNSDNEYDGFAILILQLPKVAEAPRFSEPYYSATYVVNDGDTLDTLTMGDTITLIAVGEDVNVNFADDTYSKNFDLKFDEETGTCSLSVKEDLSNQILEKGGDIILNLKATVADAEESLSAVIVSLPEVEVAKFTETNYVGVYKIKEDTATVDIPGVPIQVKPESNSIDVTFAKVNDNFEIKKDTEEDKWVITVKNKLSDDDLAKAEPIVLTLQAEIVGSKSIAKSTLVIELPKTNNPKTLKFNEPSFTFSYKVDNDKPSIDYGGKSISLDNGDSDTEITITGSYGENFKTVPNTDNTYSIEIVTPLEQKTLDTLPDILLVLDAKSKESDDGFATVLLNLPKKNIAAVPKFKDVSFTAEYKLGDKQDTIEVQDKVVLQSGTTEADVTLTGTNSEHFQVTKNDDGKTYDVSLLSNLDDKVLIGEVDVVLTLQAKKEGIDGVGEATFVVKLPKKVAPASFKQAFYEAEYDRSGDKHSISMTDKIELDGDYLDQTIVSLESEELKDYFDISKTSPYEINLVKNLEDDILDKRHEVVITVVATLKESTPRATASVIVKIPDLPKAPKFTHITYTAKYDDNEETVTLDDGQSISTDATNPASVKMTIVGPYNSNFDITYDDKTGYAIKVLTPLDQDTVDKEDEIYVTLDATVDNALEHNYATLVVKMPSDPNEVVPEFSDVLYKGSYGSDDKVEVLTPITISSDHASDTIVKVIDNYETNFEAEFDSTSWQIKVKEKLDDKVDKEIFVTLEASLTGSAKTSRAVLKLDLPDQDLKPAPRFVNPHYEAEYKVENDAASIVMVGDEISIDSSDEDLVIVTLDSYQTNFKLTHDKDKKEWHISIDDPLKDEDLDKQELVIILVGQLDKSEGDAKATLLIKLPEKPQEVITFDHSYYKATYTVVDKADDTLESDTITVSIGATVKVIEDYAENFDVSCEDTTCTLTVIKDLSQDILDEQNEVIVVLQASKDTITEKITAPVVVSLPLQELIQAPEFDQVVYKANYEVDSGNGKLTANTIKIKNVDDVNLVDVTLDGEYKEHFKVTLLTDHWQVEAIDTLPEDIEDVSILLTLKAAKKDVTAIGEAGFVVTLPTKEVSDNLVFSEVTYVANYVIQDDTDTVTLEKNIEINEYSDVTKITLTIETGDDEHFELKPETDHWTLAVKTDLPSEVLSKQEPLFLTLKAVLNDDKSTSGRVGVVIQLPQQTTSEVLQFSEVTYTALYTVTDGDDLDEVTLDKNIAIDGISDSSEATLDIVSGDTNGYFEVTADTNHWTLSVKTNLPSDVLNKQEPIILTLNATLKENEAVTGETGVVIKLPQQKNSDVLEFTEVAYIAEYNVKKDGDEVTLENNIKINGVTDASTITLDIIAGDAEHFDLKPEDDHWNLSVKADLPSDTIDSEISLLLTLKATKDDASGETGIVIKLPKKYSPTSFYFEDSVYTADYKIEDNKATFKVDKDILIKNDADGAASVGIIGEYQKYLSAKYANGEVTIELVKNLPSDVVDKEPAVSLTIVATKDTEEAKAALVIKLPKSKGSDNDDDDSSDDKKGLIAAIAVLAVLLVASIVGSAVFFYLKFKTAKNYSNMDDTPRPSERFRKNSSNDTRHKFGHPTRRPTGVIKYPLVDETVNEVATDEPPAEKRKSVQFDVVHIDELEIESEKMDDDENENNNESVDTDLRRNSEA